MACCAGMTQARRGLGRGFYGITFECVLNLAGLEVLERIAVVN